MAWGASSSSASPPSPGASPGTAKAVIPRDRAPGVVRANSVYTSASGALEIHALAPVSRNPSPSASARSSSPPASDPASGSDSANAATARPATSSGSSRPRTPGLPATAIGCAAQPLEGQRRLRLGRLPRQPLPQQAQLRRRRRPPGGAGTARQHPSQQPVVPERRDQLPVHPPGPPGGGQRDQHLPGQLADLGHQPFLGVRERKGPPRRVGHERSSFPRRGA